MAVLKGLANRWEDISKELAFNHKKFADGTSEEEKLRAAIEYWLQWDPYASWRKLIWRLDISEDEEMCRVADNIRSYAEDLAGQKIET